MYDTVVFDLDGTLLDTLEDLCSSTNYALRIQGFPERNIDEVRRFVGNGIGKLIERAVPEGTGDAKIRETYDCFMTYYDKHCMDRTAPYEGILDLLAELKNRRIKMAIVSNKMNNAVVELKNKFFADYIDIAIGECPGVRRKPAPDSVLKALRLLGSKCGNTLYVGDSDVDVMTARNAGTDVVSVLWGFRDREFLEAAGAKKMIQKPEEILEYYNKH